MYLLGATKSQMCHAASLTEGGVDRYEPDYYDIHHNDKVLI